MRFADMAIIFNNENNTGKLPLANSITLGKEWGYYKKNIDKQKREERKDQDGGAGGGGRRFDDDRRERFGGGAGGRGFEHRS
mmetsp:Transcript_46385/g.34073  ORF Transcript_46385/g.34073 Transcript_46385/m.34073 type:complete len:82 (+) Transcript_46385:929-1174(+)